MPGPVGPAGIVTDLRPGQASFQQMHVRIRFEESSRSLARVKCAVAGSKTRLDRPTQVERAFLELVTCVERGGCGGISQQCECLIIEQRPIVQGRSIDRGQGSK